MHYVLLGQGPLPSSSEPFCTFPQLRTWSLWKSLSQWCRKEGHTLELLLLDDREQPETYNVYAAKDMQALYQRVQSADAIITAGPFLPLIALLHLPTDIPLWLDYPSDPLADREAKHALSSLNNEEWCFVSELVDYAQKRADAIGVISHRQRWATTGQRLWLHCPSIPIHHLPIAFDFPMSMVHQSHGQDILLAGSNNAWLNIPKLEQALQNQTVHCTGMDVPHLEESSHRLPPSWTVHGWLSTPDLQKVIKTCQFGVWADRHGTEPLLGSRTRALFYLWNGLTPIGDTTTELASLLYEAQSMRSWEDSNPFQPVNIHQVQEFCRKTFAPDNIYQPLFSWMKSPSKTHPLRQSETLLSENRRLRQTLQNIYNTPTWRWGSKLHGWINRIIDR